MMKEVIVGMMVLLTCFSTKVLGEEVETKSNELDVFWSEVSRTVGEGDFEAYVATCHPQGVLVSGTKKASYPLSKALAGWKPEFEATRSGGVKNSVEFRFSQRLGGDQTAHETGMFRYSGGGDNGEMKTVYIHFEALLVKKEKWQIMMEYQKAEGTKEEWDKLGGSPSR